MKKLSKLFLAIALIVCLTASTVACAKKHHQYVDDTPKKSKSDSGEDGGSGGRYVWKDYRET